MFRSERLSYREHPSITRFALGAVRVLGILAFLGLASLVVPALANGQEVCPEGGDWSSHQNPPLVEIPGAVEYCGKWSTTVVVGTFEQVLNALNSQKHALSHWSYRLGEPEVEFNILLNIGIPKCGVISFSINGFSDVDGIVNVYLDGNLYGQSPYSVNGNIVLNFHNVPVVHGLHTVRAVLSADGLDSVERTAQITDVPCTPTPTSTPPTSTPTPECEECTETPTPTPTFSPTPPKECNLIPQYEQWKLWDSDQGENYISNCYIISVEPPSVERQASLCTLCGDQLEEEGYRYQADRWRHGTVYLDECTGEYVFIFDGGTRDDEWSTHWFRGYMQDNIRTQPRCPDCEAQATAQASN